MQADERAISSTVGTVLMVAVLVTLASVVAVSMTSLAQETPEEAGPYAATRIDADIATSGNWINQCKNAGGGESGLVTLEHSGGESIPIDQLEIHVEAEGHVAKMQSLPTEFKPTGTWFDVVKAQHLEDPDNLISSPDPCFKGLLSKGSTSKTWTTGETLGFRVNHADIDSGDTISVSIVDIEQNIRIDKVEVEAVS